ncbi:MAG TPA: hypothetical protein VGP36_00075 [Mycobacteriales bacterium]|jgi:hypothetical protein|nr:hypothetical protein [Mycobacteriales bacterium]
MTPAPPAAGGTVRLDGRLVPLIRLPDPPPEPDAVAAALARAGLPVGRRPVVVLVGGAGRLVVPDPPAWAALFRDGLVAGLVRAGGCLLDGGTDAGVLRLAGVARAAAGADYPAVGVVAEGTVRWPGRKPALPDAADLGPQHTHLVVVPGSAWGLDPPWISLVAGALAGPAPALTVVVNGGPITAEDVRRSLDAGRRVVVVAGSGRLADALAAARRRPSEARPEDAAFAASPLLDVVEGLREPQLLADAIAALADGAR